MEKSIKEVMSMKCDVMKKSEEQLQSELVECKKWLYEQVATGNIQPLVVPDDVDENVDSTNE